MKRALLPLMVGSLVAGGAAYAQTWNVEGPFRDEFGGCFRVSTGQVQCLLKSTYTGSGPTYYGATYYATDAAAYAPDNKRYIAVQSTINGRDVSKANVNVSKASPVTVVYTFNYPRNYDSISLLFLDTGTLRSVPVKPLPGAPASASASAATSAAPASAVAKAAPVSAATTAAPAVPRPSSFDIKLIGCTFNAQGGYSCKGAEIIPVR